MHLERRRLAFSVAVGVGVVAFAVAIEEALPALAGAIVFPGLIVGSVLFGHSIAMVVTGVGINVALYAALAFFLLKGKPHIGKENTK